jgi:hypothetical protein
MVTIQPTYDDANLLLRLFELRREDKMRAARDWFAQNFHFHTLEEFNQKCPPSSSMNAYARMVISYWDMVASFITGGVLNQDLFFQSQMELLFVWQRVSKLIPEMRAVYKNPTAYQNLETVASAYIKWLDGRAPEAHAAFAARVG